MKLVGTLVGKSGTRYVTFRVFEEVNVNDLVLIENSKRRFLGVVRWISHVNIAKNQYSPFIVQGDEETIDALGYMNASAELLGVLDDEGRLIPRITIPPLVGSKSDIYLLEEGDEILVNVSEPVYIGVYSSSSRLFQLDASYVNYHIAVVGTTGTGKSHLVRLLAKAFGLKGIKSIIFDHTGQDYAPFFKEDSVFRVIEDREILPSPAGIASVIANEVGNEYAEDIEISIYAYLASGGNPEEATEFFEALGLMEDYRKSRRYSLVQSGKPRNIEIAEPEEFKNVEWRNEEYLEILRYTMALLARRNTTIAKVIMRYLVSGLDLAKFNGRKYTPREVAELLVNEDKSLVLDLSNEPMAIKWSLLKDTIKFLWEKVQERGGDRIAIIVDEAQNYASAGTPTAPILEEIARRGRKFGVGLILASQRWVTDLSTGIRNNINTVFFSQLAVESDIAEISKVVATENVDLSSLDRGYFYVSGLLNPMRKPLLLHTFPTVKEVVETNAGK